MAARRGDRWHLTSREQAGAPRAPPAKGHRVTAAETPPVKRHAGPGDGARQPRLPGALPSRADGSLATPILPAQRASFTRTRPKEPYLTGGFSLGSWVLGLGSWGFGLGVWSWSWPLTFENPRPDEKQGRMGCATRAFGPGSVLSGADSAGSTPPPPRPTRPQAVSAQFCPTEPQTTASRCG